MGCPFPSFAKASIQTKQNIPHQSVYIRMVGDFIFNNKPLIKLANFVVYNSILMALSCFWLPTILILTILLRVYYWKSNHPPFITLQRIFRLPPFIVHNDHYLPTLRILKSVQRQLWIWRLLVVAKLKKRWNVRQQQKQYNQDWEMTNSGYLKTQIQLTFSLTYHEPLALDWAVIW